MTNLVRYVVTIAACLFAAACSTNVSRFQMPGTDLAQIQAFHVRPPTDDPATQELHQLIMTDLEQRGYVLFDMDDVPNAGAAVARFEYKADWAWDITPYLLELRVAIYDLSDDTLIAQAQSLQTSLVRKSNNTVVERAIAILFDDPLQPIGANRDEETDSVKTDDEQQQ